MPVRLWPLVFSMSSIAAAAARSLRPRQVQQVWGGANVTAQVLCIANSISHPVCNATSYCVQLVTQLVSESATIHDSSVQVLPRTYAALLMVLGNEGSYFIFLVHRYPNAKCLATIQDAGVETRIRCMSVLTPMMLDEVLDS